MWSLDENQAIVVRYFEEECWAWGFCFTEPFQHWVKFILSLVIWAHLCIFNFDFISLGQDVGPTNWGLLNWGSSFAYSIVPSVSILDQTAGMKCLSNVFFGGQGLPSAGSAKQCALKFVHLCKFPLNWVLSSVTPEPWGPSSSPTRSDAFYLSHGVSNRTILFLIQLQQLQRLTYSSTHRLAQENT